MHLLLRQRQGLALGHAQLPFDQIKPGAQLCHRVFDLQPGVHFHQEEFGLAVGFFEQEFDRAGTHIASGLGQFYGASAHAFA